MIYNKSIRHREVSWLKMWHVEKLFLSHLRKIIDPIDFKTPNLT